MSQWAGEVHGLGDDWYTAFQFDRAVSFVGNWIESKLAEFDKKSGRPLHDLETILAEDDDTPWWRQPMSIRGIFALVGNKSQVKHEVR